MVSRLSKVFSVSVTDTVDEEVLSAISAPPGVKGNTFFVAPSFDGLNDTTLVTSIVNRICLFHRNYLCESSFQSLPYHNGDQFALTESLAVGQQSSQHYGNSHRIAQFQWRRFR